MNLRTTFYHLHTETKDRTAIVEFICQDDLEDDGEGYPVSFNVRWMKREEKGFYSETEDENNEKSIDFTTEEARDLVNFLKFALGDFDNPK